MKAERMRWMVSLAALLLASCTYESTNLGDVICDESGAVEAGRRCVDGVWVALDQGAPEDMPADLKIDDMPPADLGDMPCVPESEGALCAARQASCGMITTTDRCGAARTIDCGICIAPDTCGGNGQPNRCGCPCSIDGACVEAGALNPQNSCEACIPMTSRTEWSPVDAEEACDDGQFCTEGERCDGQGACEGGAARDCSGAAQEQCSVGVCNEAAGMCAVTFAPLNTRCNLSEDPPTCVSGGCDAAGMCQPRIDSSSCLIDGMCFAANALNPANPCQRCVPAQDQEGWSPVGEGVSCGMTACGQRFCNAQGACVLEPTLGCLISGQCVAADAPNPSNPCQVCKPSVSATSWTNANNGVACPADNKICTLDVCQNGACVHPAAHQNDNCNPLAGDTCSGMGNMCRCDAGTCINR